VNKKYYDLYLSTFLDRLVLLRFELKFELHRQTTESDRSHRSTSDGAGMTDFLQKTRFGGGHVHCRPRRRNVSEADVGGDMMQPAPPRINIAGRAVCGTARDQVGQYEPVRPDVEITFLSSHIFSL
jgi:hypothetical protein